MRYFKTLGTTAALLLMTLCGPATRIAWSHDSISAVETVYAFDFNTRPRPFTEGLAIDKRGNIFVGLYLKGEIWKFTPDGTPTVFATLDVGNQGGGLVGLAFDDEGNLYACLASYVQGTHGIWKIDRWGHASLFAALDPFAQPVPPLPGYMAFGLPSGVYGFPNAIAVDHDGNMYVSDSYLALIWKITRSGKVSVWLQDPLLDWQMSGQGYGANGLEFDRGSLFIANTDQSSIVRVPVREEGRAGVAAIYAQDPIALQGADGIAFDVQHNIYVANDIINTLARVSPQRVITTLATAASALDYPASTSFGSTEGHRRTLYFTNNGSFFNTPSLQKIEVGVEGDRLP